MLATGTTQGDVLVPGFASMVHGRLGGGPMELLSAAGVCASGMAALKAAVSAVRLGEHPVAVAVGSELVSRSPHGRRGRRGGAAVRAGHRFPALDPVGRGRARWWSSPRPGPDGLSLRVDWMHLVSHAHEHPVCMSAGLGDGHASPGRARPGSTTRPRDDRHRDAAPAPGHVGAARADRRWAWPSSTRWSRPGGSTPGPSTSCATTAPSTSGGKLFSRLREAGHAPGRRALVHQPAHGGQHRRGQHLRDARRGQAAAAGRATGCCWWFPESGRFTLAFAHLTCVGPR